MKILNTIGLDTEIPKLYTDSQNTLIEVDKPALSTKFLWLDSRYYFVKDTVKKGYIYIKLIKSANNIANSLTKPLPINKFRKFTAALQLYKLTNWSLQIAVLTGHIWLYLIMNLMEHLMMNIDNWLRTSTMRNGQL